MEYKDLTKEQQVMYRKNLEMIIKTKLEEALKVYERNLHIQKTTTLDADLLLSISENNSQIDDYRYYLAQLNKIDRPHIVHAIRYKEKNNISKVLSVSKTIFSTTKRKINEFFDDVKIIFENEKKVREEERQKRTKKVKNIKDGNNVLTKERKEEIKKDIIKNVTTNFNLTKEKQFLKIENFISSFKDKIVIKKAKDIKDFTIDKYNIISTKVGEYKKSTIENFWIMLDEIEKKQQQKTDYLKSEIEQEKQRQEEIKNKIRKRNNGYINFYLIFISTLFLSLLSLLLGLKILER